MNMDELLNRIGEKTQPQQRKQTAPKIQMIHYSKLIPNDANFYETDDVEKLAAAIRIAGEIKNPLRVRKTDIDEYEVNEGHRRRLATIYNVEQLGLKKFEFVPCIVEETDNIVGRLNLILSNSTQRERTEHEKMIETQRLRELLEEYAKENETKFSAVEIRQLIADILGVSKTKVAQLESINHNLVPEAKERFERDEMPVSIATEMASLAPEKQRELTRKPDLKLEDVKKAKKKVYETKPCSEVPNIECCIEEVMGKYFTKHGNIVGCAGCCKYCLRKDECEHTCVVVKANQADSKDQMSIDDLKEEPKYFTQKELEELTFTFQDIKIVLGKYKKELQSIDRKDVDTAREIKIITESMKRLLKEMVVIERGE